MRVSGGCATVCRPTTAGAVEEHRPAGVPVGDRQLLARRHVPEGHRHAASPHLRQDDVGPAGVVEASPRGVPHEGAQRDGGSVGDGPPGEGPHPVNEGGTDDGPARRG